MKYYLLDMSGYVLSAHKTLDAALAAQLKEWKLNSTKGMSVESTNRNLKKGSKF
jgi:hypothetical protein